MQNLEEKIAKIYDTLPPEIQSALTSTKTNDDLVEIGKAHKLFLDQIDALIEETGYVMLGITPTTEFIDTLETRLDINTEEATSIAKSVNDSVFANIREALHQVETGNDDGTTASPVTLSNTTDEIPEEHHEAVRNELLSAIEETPKNTTTTPPKNLPKTPPQELVNKQVFGKTEVIGAIAAIKPPTIAPEIKKEPSTPGAWQPIKVERSPVSAQNPVTAAPAASTAPASPQNPIKKEYGVDPYREQIDPKDTVHPAARSPHAIL